MFVLWWLYKLANSAITILENIWIDFQQMKLNRFPCKLCYQTLNVLQITSYFFYNVIQLLLSSLLHFNEISWKPIRASVPNCSLARFLLHLSARCSGQDKQLLSIAAPGASWSLYGVYLCLNNIRRLKRGGCWEGFQDDKMERTDTKHENTRTLHIPTHW